MHSNQQQTITQHKSHTNPKYSTQPNQPNKQTQVDKQTSNKIHHPNYARKQHYYLNLTNPKHTKTRN